MRISLYFLSLISGIVLLSTCNKDSNSEPFFLDAVFLGNRQIVVSDQVITDTPLDLPLELVFSSPVDAGSAPSAIFLQAGTTSVDIDLRYTNGNRNIKLTPANTLANSTIYTLDISNALKSRSGAAFAGQQLRFQTIGGTLELVNFTIDDQSANAFASLIGISLQPVIDLQFSAAIDTSSLKDNIALTGSRATQPSFDFSQDQKQVRISYSAPLEDWTQYQFTISDQLVGTNGEHFETFRQAFYTKVDETQKFPTIPDDELLTRIQEQTFAYFWDFGHPVSGLARERNTSNETITFGGSGFGLMAMIVAVERGFITLSQALDRWRLILQFLQTADRFHGAFPHWMNGTTGKVQPFSARDDGADLVETAFFIQGLLTVREYLKKEAPQETEIIDQINQFWRAVEWDWFTKGENEGLFWHWSPEHQWAINLKISGHNETQIVYILAASSPTHTITKEHYDNGYARSGQMVNGKTFYAIELPLGRDLGGPLFFTHYSYLGLDPRNLKDQYADYWKQNVNHSRINQAYCRDNPKNYVGYSDLCWGLTASDGNNGYSAHSPSNDRGVITPTAAISSLPYTPDESMAAIRHFYYTLGDRLWGKYGFYDAFNPTEGWVASSFLAIDQGPIICMIENHRTGLLWELFMQAPEIETGLKKLDFTF